MKKFAETLGKIQIAVGGAFLMIFLATVVIQMLTRYMGIVATWTDEVSMYAFIWAVFMGASTMVLEQRHFAFTSLSDSLKDEKKKAIVAMIIDIVMFVFCILMLYYGSVLAKKFWNYTWTSPALNTWKRGPVWLCIPVCGVTSAIYLIYNFTEEIKKLTKGGNK